MKGQRVVWPSRAKVEIEEFEFPSLGDNEILVATECFAYQSRVQSVLSCSDCPMHRTLPVIIPATAISAWSLIVVEM